MHRCQLKPGRESHIRKPHMNISNKPNTATKKIQQGCQHWQTLRHLQARQINSKVPHGAVGHPCLVKICAVCCCLLNFHHCHTIALPIGCAQVKGNSEVPKYSQSEKLGHFQLQAKQHLLSQIAKFIFYNAGGQIHCKTHPGLCVSIF